MNHLLSFSNLEIRKRKAFPGYYLQHFPLPNFPCCNGVYTVSIDKIISPHGFSSSKGGWHYYSEFLKQYEAQPDVSYEGTVLKKYYDVFQPQSVADILFFDDKNAAPNILQKMHPLLIRDFWRLDGSLEEITAHIIEEETQLFGSISDIYGEEQFIRCINAYRLVKKHGYLPDRFEDGYLCGYFLINGDDYRFLAMAGKHRLAAFSVLDIHDIKVTVPYNLKVLDIKDIDKWPTVQSGLFTKEQIECVFHRFFEEDGTGFAVQYDLEVKL